MKFLIATSNKGKISEIREILTPLGIETVTPADLDFKLIEPIEDGVSFYENAMIKAKNYVGQTNMAVIAEDSGLCVDALGGSPGIHSARYGNTNDSEVQISILLQELANAEKRSANFNCTLVALWPNHEKIIANGKVFGKIAHEPSGDNGFGYDPIFKVGSVTLAEMSVEEKNKISHRRLALEDFARQLKEKRGE